MKKSGSIREYAEANKLDWRNVYNHIKANTFHKNHPDAKLYTENQEVMRIEWEE